MIQSRTRTKDKLKERDLKKVNGTAYPPKKNVMTSADKPKNMLSVIAQINDKFNKVERKYDAQQLNSCIRNRETMVNTCQTR